MFCLSETASYHVTLEPLLNIGECECLNGLMHVKVMLKKLPWYVSGCVTISNLNDDCSLIYSAKNRTQGKTRSSLR